MLLQVLKSKRKIKIALHDQIQTEVNIALYN